MCVPVFVCFSGFSPLGQDAGLIFCSRRVCVCLFLCAFGFCHPLGQDAGLIFLSRMTTDVAKHVQLRGGTADEAVATALAATAFATASLGVALVVIGKLKLARFVAYLPMPVVSQGVKVVCINIRCLVMSRWR